ncbi:MAG TPA: addiction module toxin RelE [Kiloniellaceae bacterium]|nr:addiction module toxin RelE [Kiloniellaceae bacterium]HIP78011.1 addiction module toxin RelE [Kiloniellaceae bacterium]
MARPLRLERPGAAYFISTLGNAGLTVFRAPEDSRRFLEILGETCARYRWRCLAYCLLPDRYSLVIVTEAPTLSRGMRQINGRYTQAFHRHHGTAGHLFQGRYRAVMIEPGPLLAAVCCEVLRQPVAEGLAPDAAAWRWSSARHCLHRPVVGGQAREEERLPWLDSDGLLAAFAPDQGRAEERQADPEQARARLAARIAAVPAVPVWEHLSHQVFLGSPAFVEAMRTEASSAAAERGSLSEIPRAQWQAPPPPLQTFVEQAQSRDEAMALAYGSGHYSQASIAAYFDIHYSSVSRAIRRHERTLAAGRVDA